MKNLLCNSLYRVFKPFIPMDTGKSEEMEMGLMILMTQ